MESWKGYCRRRPQQTIFHQIPTQHRTPWSQAKHTLAYHIQAQPPAVDILRDHYTQVPVTISTPSNHAGL